MSEKPKTTGTANSDAASAATPVRNQGGGPMLSVTLEELNRMIEAKMAEVKAQEAEQAELTAKDRAHRLAEQEARAEAWLNDLVEVRLFKDGKEYKDDVTVAVNGEVCRIQRGVKVKIRRKFALVLEQAEAQAIKAAEYNEAKAAEYRQNEAFLTV